MKTILLIPFGEIDQEILLNIGVTIEHTFAHPVEQMFHHGLLSRIRVRIAPPIPIPESAYNPRRKQYHSSMMIQELKGFREHQDDLILGIADVDLYVPQLNFVFGEADVLNGIAVISLTRLREEFYRSRPDQRLLIQRAIKEAIHEIGHLFGLDHCQDRKCIMFFSNSIRDTDIKGPGFCKSCKRRLG